jgi:Tfp pilus assembly protein PilF
MASPREQTRAKQGKSQPRSAPKKASSAPKASKPTKARSSEAPKVTISESPKTYYKAGVKALNQGAFDKSIESFSKCIQADMNYSLCYRAMGITYARMKNGPKAARYYRLYLKVSPNAKDAAKVRQFLSQFEGE